MRLVFTKLNTPLMHIEVDYGDGEFRRVDVGSLPQDETKYYIQLDDDAIAKSIRVRVSSGELDNFYMIKDYQIRNDDGSLVGGTSEIEIENINFYLEDICQGCSLQLGENESKIRYIFNSLCDNLYYRVLDQYYHMQGLAPYEIACQAENSLLYLITYGVEADIFYTPLPYRIKFENQTENPDFEEPMPEQPSEQN